MPDRRTIAIARTACGVGLAFAAVSVYWALGGMWLVNTLGHSFEEQARDRDTGMVLVTGLAGVLKAVAAVLPLFALHRLATTSWERLVWLMAWAAAAILTVYGLVLTTTGLAVQAGLLQASADADHRGLVWHAYLWDPWFLVWGLLAGAALLRGRQSRAARPAAG